MDSIVALNGNRSGRDKIFRLSQYTLKILNDFHCSATNDTKQLERNLASFRKLLRLGTFADTLYGLKKSSSYSDPFLALVTSLSRLALAGYLLNDHLVWLHQQDLRQLQNASKVSRRSDEWWLLSIVLCLLRDVYQLRLCQRDHQGSCSERRALWLDLCTQTCDLCIPLASLNLAPLPNWVVGLMGVTSSITAAWTILHKEYKVTPPH